MNHTLDILSIGDVVTDAFIKLQEDQAWVGDGDQGPVLSMRFGTKLPFTDSEVVEGVGNAANAAVAFAKLGFKSGLVSNVGDDQWGRDIIGTLKTNEVDTRFVHINPGHKSNYHYVLNYKEERTILIKHEEYDYHWPRFRVADEPRWVYFSSIAQKAIENYHDEVADWLDENPEIKFAFQPGTFQMDAGIERLARLYRRSEVVLVNREEAAQIFGGNRDDMHDLFNRMHESGVTIAVITDGPAGAYASSGEERLKMPPYPDPEPPKERTGAGDAFSSTFVAALMDGQPLSEALRWAPINSMNVVQHTGAQAGLLSRDELLKYLADAPDWYQPERI